MRFSYIFKMSFLLFVFIASCKVNQVKPTFELPGNKPQLIAPNFINTDSVEINVVFNNAMDECFFMRIINKHFLIFHTELKQKKWSKPEPIYMFIKDSISHAIDMTLTQDGKTMYFLGVSPPDIADKNPPDIYKSVKINGEWQKATKVVYPVSTDEYVESYPVVVADGSLYFTSNRPSGLGGSDIYRAQYLGDENFDVPKNLGIPINTSNNERSTYVSPDEIFLITTTSNIESKRGFYISHKKDNLWQPLEFIDIGEPFEEDWMYMCPYMLPDGKTLIYSRKYNNPKDKSWNGVEKGEVYWVNISRYTIN